jgi:hypothetical protein
MKLNYATYVLPYTYARAAAVAGLTAIVVSILACVTGIVTRSELAPLLAIVATIFLMMAGCTMLMIHLLRLRGPDRVGRFLKSARLAIILMILDLPVCVAAVGVQHYFATRHGKPSSIAIELGDAADHADAGKQMRTAFSM